MRKQTPWGIAQTAEELADGIVSYSTASHGGIWLSANRRAEIAPVGAITWLGTREWWEEDSDWSVPYYFFREAIRDHGTAYRLTENLAAAERTIQAFHKECAAYLGLAA